MALRLKKAGGGFLNGESANLVGLKFEEKSWDDDRRSASVELLIQRDGVDEPVQQFAEAGTLWNAEHVVSDDGTTIDGADGEPLVDPRSQFGRLVTSAVEAGFPENELDEEDPNNFQALVGYRYTFGKEIDTDRQMAAGRKKLGIKAKSFVGKGGKTYTEEEIMTAGRRQDKNDKSKFYNHDRLIITAVVGKVDEAPAKGKKAAPKAAAAKAAPAAKAGKAKKDADENFDDADTLLMELLGAAKGKTIEKGKLSSLIVRKALADDMENEARDAFRKLLGSDEFLARENGWSYDADAKGQPITLA
jgi:hypothetical protein